MAIKHIFGQEKLLKIVKALVSLSIIIFIILNIDVGRIIKLLLNSRLEFVLLALLLVIFQLVISAKNQGILVAKEKKIPFHKMLQYYCFGWTAGLISVGKIAEFSVSYYFKKEGIPYSKSLAIVLMDKFITLVIFVAIAIIGTIWFFGFSNSLLLGFSLLLLIGLAGFLLCFLQEKFGKQSWIFKIPLIGAFIEKRRRNLIIFRSTFFNYFTARKDALVKNVLLTLVKLIGMSVTAFTLYLAINNTIDIFYMMYIIVITAIIALIPITISGLGVVEITYIYLASLIGISAEVAVATELMALFLNYSIGMIIVLFWMHKMPNFQRGK